MRTACLCAGLRSCQISQIAQMHKGLSEKQLHNQQRHTGGSGQPTHLTDRWPKRGNLSAAASQSSHDVTWHSSPLGIFLVLLPSNTLPGGSKCRWAHDQLAEVGSRQEPIWCFVPLQLHHHLLWPRGFPWRKLGKQKKCQCMFAWQGNPSQQRNYAIINIVLKKSNM